MNTNYTQNLKRLWEPNPQDEMNKHLNMLMSLQASSHERQVLFEKVAQWVLDRIPKPKDGYTPIKGRDYIDGRTPTREEIISLIKPLTPKSKDGHTPTREELLEIIEPLIPYVHPAKDGKTPGKEELINLIRPIVAEMTNPLPIGQEKPTYDEIKGVAEPIIRQLLTEQKKGWFGGGGGGDLVGAGSGVTITQNAIGRKIISASGGGATVSTPTGSVNSVNTVFTVTAEPNYVVADGVTYFDGAGYVFTGPTTITLDIPPSQYVRAIT